MLAKMYPRIRGVPAAATRQNAKTKSKMSNNEKQVYEWLKGMMVDMSQYAPKFFAQGFDSMDILKTMEPEDVEELVEKKAHRRIIQNRLRPMAVKNRKEIGYRQKPKRPKRSLSDLDDSYASDDGFVVNDEDAYQPGMVSNMMMKRYDGRDAYDDDSSDMEASYDEMQREEDHSARYGAFEDEREERRNKYLEQIEKRKQKKKLRL